MASLKFRIIIEKDSAKASVKEVETQVEGLKAKAETPQNLKFNAQNALATIRDVMLNLQSLKSLVDGVINKANDFLNASLKQKQAVKLVNIAFKEQAKEILNLASGLQAVTNHGDEELLPLMAKLAQTYKLTSSEVSLLSPLLIDFAEANASTGMTISTAFDLMGRALTGNTSMLGRYGIELDKTRLAQEGVSYLAEKLSKDYGGVSKALADLRLQNQNAWGDIKEQIGSMLNTLITPLLKGIKSLFDWYNKLTPAVKGFVAGLVIAIPVIGTITTAITILTSAVIALKTAINPVVGVLSLLAVGLTATGFAFASTKVETENAEEALARYKKQAQDAKDKMDSLIANMTSFNELVRESREEVNSLSYDEAKNEYNKIGDAISEVRDKYNKALESADQNKSWELFEKERTLLARQTALRKKLFDDDMQAIKDYHSGKLLIEKENTYEGIRLLKLRIKNAKDEYDQIKEINASTVNDKLSAYSKWQALEKQLSDAIQAENVKRSDIEKKYQILAIEDSLDRKLAQLENEKQAELKRAEELKSSQQTLLNIKSYYINEEKRIREEDAKQKETELEQERVKQQQHEQELENIRDQFHAKSEELSTKTYNSELKTVTDYYDRKKNKLIEAGFTEEQITEQIESAKQRIRDTYQMRAMQGFSGMFGNIAKTASAFGKKGFKVWKAMSMTQALVDTYASATGAYKAMVGIPVIGPGLAIAAAASAIAAGLANVSMISKQKYQEAEDGGLMKGPSHAMGGFLINMEGDEYITRKARVRQLGAKFFDFINYAPIDKVRQLVGGSLIPNIPVASTPMFSYASGGQVAGTNSLAILISRIEDLITENVLLRKTLQDKKMVVNNHISANDILESADAVLIADKNEQGTLLKGEL